MSDCFDPALSIITVIKGVLQQVFDPNGECPPDAGTTDVRFFAADSHALPPVLLPGADDCNPVVWLRVDRRYRALRSAFPQAFVGDQPCNTPDAVNVLAVEIGVTRCTSLEVNPDWDEIDQEALTALDDSWRIEKAMCAISGRLRTKQRAVATDTVAPIGPDGGVQAWTGMVYIQI